MTVDSQPSAEPATCKNKRKSGDPTRDASKKRPRVRVADLRKEICQLQVKLDAEKGVHTVHTIQLEYNAETTSIIQNYRGFVAGACHKIGVPQSFLLSGIEDGSLTSWRQARSVHEAAIHRAVADLQAVADLRS